MSLLADGDLADAGLVDADAGTDVAAAPAHPVQRPQSSHAAERRDLPRRLVQRAGLAATALVGVDGFAAVLAGLLTVASVCVEAAGCAVAGVLGAHCRPSFTRRR